jgi:hypothetical protein
MACTSLKVVSQHPARVDTARCRHGVDLAECGFPALQGVEQLDQALAHRSVAAVHNLNPFFCGSGVVPKRPWTPSIFATDARVAWLSSALLLVGTCRSELSGKQLMPVLFKIQQVTPRTLSC